MWTERISVAVVCALMCGITAAAAQDRTAQGRVTRSIDWQAANQEMQRSRQADSAGIERFRASVPTGVNEVRLPVLVLGTGPVRAAPKFGHQTYSYAALYSVDDARVSVLGSMTALPVDPGDPLAAMSSRINQVERGIFESSELAADFSFQRFGATYTIRITCARENDERCINDSFLRSMAVSLIGIGGNQQ